MKKVIVFICSILILSSCTNTELFNMMYENKNIENVTNKELKQFNNSKFTDLDILRRFKKPNNKVIYSDGRKVYLYFYGKMSKSIASPTMKQKMFNFSFVFDKNNHIVPKTEDKNLKENFSNYKLKRNPIAGRKVTKSKEDSMKLLNSLNDDFSLRNVMRIFGYPEYIFKYNNEYQLYYMLNVSAFSYNDVTFVLYGNKLKCIILDKKFYDDLNDNGYHFSYPVITKENVSLDNRELSVLGE